MRFRELHIEHFGFFSDRRIPFSPAGLQLIYGPNESGKTTLQTLLREALFGIEERSPYAFAAGDLAANVQLETADGKRLDFRRRKGRTKVVQGTITPGGALDEEGLKRMLGGIDGALYRAMFAVNQADLTAGEEALKGGARDKLYSGGMFGALDPKAVLAALGAERDLLFKLGGRSGGLLGLDKEIRELEKEARDKITRPSAYAELQKSLREKETLFETLETRFVLCQTEWLRKQRLLKALPEWIQRKQLLVEKESLAAPAGFPLELLDELKSILTGLRDASEQLFQKKQERDGIREKLSDLTVNTSLLAARVGIEACRRRAGAMEKNVIDIVKRDTEARELELRIDKALAARPEWNQAKLKAFVFEGKLHSEFELLKRQFAEQESQAVRLQGRLDAARRQRDEAAAGLEALKDVAERPDLEVLLDGHADGLGREIGALQDELRDKEADLAKAFEQLRPLCAQTPGETVSLPVPRREQMEAAHKQLADLRQLRKDALAQQGRLEAECLPLRKGLEKQPVEGVIPSVDDLRRARSERDQGWAWIRDVFIEKRAAPEAAQTWSAAPLPEAYEQSVAAADQTSDRIFSQAETVSKRELQRQELQRLENVLAGVAEDLARLDVREQAWQMEWKALWAESRLDAGSPEEMLRWHEAFRLLGPLQVECRRIAQKLEARTAEQDRFGYQLRLAMGAAETPLLQLVQTARAVVKSAREQKGARKALLEQQSRSDAELAGLADEKQRIAAAAAAWQQRWQDLLTTWGFTGEWPVEALSRETTELVALQTDLARAEEFRYRAQAMKEELALFDADVKAVLAAAAPDLAAFRPLESIEPAAKRLEAETLRDTERTLLEANAKRVQDELARLEAGLAQKSSRRDEIVGLGKVASAEAFVAVAAQAMRLAKLEDDIRQADRLLAVHRENDAVAEFEAGLASATSEELQAEAGRLQIAFNEAKAMRDKALEEKRSAADALRSVSVESEAAELYRRAESKRADFVDGADRWMVAAVAAQMLEAAIVRFERENQPRIIQEAGIIFATMTDGAYDTLSRRLDDNGTLVVSGKGNREKTPDQLSTGTREQLYLALRLAYAVDYCRENEPLPLLLDDVLVNFDERRRANTLQAIHAVAAQVQVIFLTCHADIAADVESVCSVSRFSLGDVVPA